MLSIRPLQDRVVVRRIESETVSKGGILIPETSQEKPQRGEVVATGSGSYIDGKLVPIDLRVGDEVLFGKWSGTEVKIDDETYLVMKESDVMGVIVKHPTLKVA
jgi:chaperonin GroES